MKRIAIMAAATFSTSALAQDRPPPYVQFGEAADDYAVLATSIRTCGTFGYVIDTGEAEEIGNQLTRRAVEDGIDVGFARRVIINAIRQEEENLQYLSEQVDEDDIADVDRYIDFWIARCDEVGSLYGGVISRPPPSE